MEIAPEGDWYCSEECLKAAKAKPKADDGDKGEEIGGPPPPIEVCSSSDDDIDIDIDEKYEELVLGLREKVSKGKKRYRESTPGPIARVSVPVDEFNWINDTFNEN